MYKLNLQINLLLLSFVFIIPCSSQNETTLSEATPKTDPQIAEYIRNIFQDKNGNFWFGTNKYGVVHFNGESLSYFSVEQGFEGGQITGITGDHEKNIWFATNQGVVKYDWSTTEKGEQLFTNYSADKVFNGERTWSIFSDSKGIVWVGSNLGVFRFDARLNDEVGQGTNWNTFELPYSEEYNFYEYFTNRAIWSISEDKKGNIWFGTNGNGAFKYDGKTFTQYTEKDGLSDNRICKILEDRNGIIWLGTWNGGLNKYDGKTFINYTEKDSIGNNEVGTVYEDTLGNIWFSSEGFGVYKYDGQSFSNYSNKQGLKVKAPQAIFEDKDGRLWVGGGGGLYLFDGKSFINVTKSGPWK